MRNLSLILISFIILTSTQSKESRDYKAPILSSQDELSKELSNPNTPLASLTFKTKYTTFDGNTPGADQQNSLITTFQPVFPFPLDDKTKTNLFIRPVAPIIWKAPVLGNNSTFRDVNGIGDIGFDIALGRTYESGVVMIAGMQGLIPVNNSISSKQWRLGPEFLIAKLTKKWFIAAFPAHNWNTSGRTQYSKTQLELFAGIYLQDAWTIFTDSKLFYDWRSEESTIPLNVTLRKVTTAGKVPLKIELSVDRFLKSSKAIGEEWSVGINFSPVVENFIFKAFKK